jgi:hypothetical protein
MRRPDRRRAGLVARTELRRTVRSLKDSNRGVLLLLGAVVMVPLYSLVIAGVAYLGADSLTTGDGETVRLAATALVAGLLGLVTLLVLQRTVKVNGEPDGADGLLTTAPYEDILAGLVLAEACRVYTLLALPLVALAGGLVAGTGRLLFPAVAFVTSVVVATLGVLVGYLAGLALKLLVARSLFVARHRASLGTGLSLLFVFGWVAASNASGVQRTLLRAATQSPLSWAGEILLLTVPGAGGRPLLAAVAVVALLGALPVAGLACLRLGERVWYVDPVEPDYEFDADERTLSDRLLRGRVTTGTRVVVQKSWRRAKRAPFTVQFAIMPFFFLAFQLQPVLFEQRVPPTLPLWAGLSSAAAAGAAFTLNPLGGEERVLPLTLTANISGRQFVGGLALAGVLPGAVLTTVLVVGFGIFAGLAPATLSAALATSLLATAAAPAIAATAGLVFPKFERSSVGNREAVVPSGLAFGLYFLLLGVTIAPGSLAVSLVVTGSSLSFAPSVLLGGGVAATLGLTAVGASLGFVFVAKRVGGYRLE